MMPQTATPYKPTVRMIDIHAGTYRVLSSNGLDWYECCVAAGHIRCTCKAGATGFKSCKVMPWCKHVAASKVVARAIHDMRFPARPVTNGAAGLLELFS